MARVVGKIMQNESDEKWYVDFGELQRVGPFDTIEQAKDALRARSYKLRPSRTPPKNSMDRSGPPVISATTRRRKNCRNC